MTAKTQAPLGLDRAGRCAFDLLDQLLARARGDLTQGVGGGHCRTRIAVAIEHRVGHAAVSGNRCWLPLGGLEGWYISGRGGLSGRQGVVRLLSVHGVPPGLSVNPAAYRGYPLKSHSLSFFAAVPNGPSWYTAAPAGEKVNGSNGSASILSR